MSLLSLSVMLRLPQSAGQLTAAAITEERSVNDYPVTFDVEYPDRPLNRLTTGFRIFTVIPIAIVLSPERRRRACRGRRRRAVPALL